MSGITIPTLDEITGHTVMAKLRSLCKRFIGLAEEVDEKIDAPLEEAHLAVQTANATLATAQESLENANSAVTTANSASATANSASQTATEASESAQESATTVAGYNTRLTAVENGKINITDINNYAVGLTGNQKFLGRKTGSVNISDANNMNGTYKAVVNLGPIENVTVTVAGMFFERTSMTMFRFAYNSSLNMSSQERNFVGTPAGKIGLTIFEDNVYLVIGGTTANNVGCVNTCYVHKGASLYTPAPIDAFTIAESDFVEVVFP